VIGGCGGTNGEPALQGGLGGVGEEEPAGKGTARRGEAFLT
jgi:hypothetical protein